MRIGGTPAGKVEAIRLTPNGQAEVEVSIDSSFGPLRRGTTAAVRQQSLVGVASRYVSLSPAPTFQPALADDGVVPASHTSGIVDVARFAAIPEGSPPTAVINATWRCTRSAASAGSRSY